MAQQHAWAIKTRCAGLLHALGCCDHEPCLGRVQGVGLTGAYGAAAHIDDVVSLTIKNCSFVLNEAVGLHLSCLYLLMSKARCV